MFQFQDLLLAAVTPLVSGYPPSLMPNLDAAGVHFCLNLSPHVQRRRVSVRAHTDTSHPVHHWKTHFSQVKPLLRQRQKVFAFREHGGADQHRFSHDLPLLILLTASQQLLIELIEVTRARNRNPVIPSKISGFPFYAAFLVALTRSAKLARITPVRTECYKPGRF